MLLGLNTPIVAALHKIGISYSKNKNLAHIDWIFEQNKKK